MSTAVLEQPSQAAVAFKMPKVVLGQMVVVYPGGRIDPQNATLATASKISEHCLTVSCFSQGGIVSHSLGVMDHVLHITDPRLKNDYIAAEQGAWDFTPHDKATQERISDLESKVEKLLSDLGGPSKGKKAE